MATRSLCPQVYGSLASTLETRARTRSSIISWSSRNSRWFSMKMLVALAADRMSLASGLPNSGSWRLAASSAPRRPWPSVSGTRTIRSRAIESPPSTGSSWQWLLTMTDPLMPAEPLSAPRLSSRCETTRGRSSARNGSRPTTIDSGPFSSRPGR